jgi:hypothetical protein
MAKNAQEPMMQFTTLLLPLHEMLIPTWDKNNLHVLPFATSNSSCRQVDIVFNKDVIHTLVDVLIVDPTQVDSFFKSCATQGFATFNATQAKERGYHN